MQNDSLRGDFPEELIAHVESSTNLGGGANNEVHGKVSRARETNFRGLLCTGTVVGHDYHQIDIRITRWMAIGVGAEENHLSGTEVPDDPVSKVFYLIKRDHENQYTIAARFQKSA
jgi:hypothetical protein